MQSPLAAVVFYELIRFHAPDADDVVEKARAAIDARHPNDRVRASLAAHAPYSVAPSLFRAIKRAVDCDPSAPCSVHLSESVEEVEFIEHGTGPWRALLEELGVWHGGWSVPSSQGVLNITLAVNYSIQTPPAGDRSSQRRWCSRQTVSSSRRR